ncbi:unnamed protein product, partial [Prorocentrum cordatum]
MPNATHRPLNEIHCIMIAGLGFRAAIHCVIERSFLELKCVYCLSKTDLEFEVKCQRQQSFIRECIVNSTCPAVFAASFA